MKIPILEIIELDFAHIEIYENHIISQIKEGITFEEEHLDQVYNLFKTYFSEKPFISIADRKFDYTIDPNLLRNSKFENLLGIGVVCYSEASYKTALFEKEFYNGVFEIFYSLEDCQNWSRSLLKQYDR